MPKSAALRLQKHGETSNESRQELPNLSRHSSLDSSNVGFQVNVEPPIVDRSNTSRQELPSLSRQSSLNESNVGLQVNVEPTIVDSPNESRYELPDLSQHSSLDESNAGLLVNDEPPNVDSPNESRYELPDLSRHSSLETPNLSLKVNYSIVNTPITSPREEMLNLSQQELPSVSRNSSFGRNSSQQELPSVSQNVSFETPNSSRLNNITTPTPRRRNEIGAVMSIRRNNIETPTASRRRNTETSTDEEWTVPKATRRPRRPGPLCASKKKSKPGLAAVREGSSTSHEPESPVSVQNSPHSCSSTDEFTFAERLKEKTSKAAGVKKSSTLRGQDSDCSDDDDDKTIQPVSSSLIETSSSDEDVPAGHVRKSNKVGSSNTLTKSANKEETNKSAIKASETVKSINNNNSSKRKAADEHKQSPAKRTKPTRDEFDSDSETDEDEYFAADNNDDHSGPNLDEDDNLICDTCNERLVDGHALGEHIVNKHPELCEIF